MEKEMDGEANNKKEVDALAKEVASDTKEVIDLLDRFKKNPEMHHLLSSLDKPSEQKEIIDRLNLGGPDSPCILAFKKIYNSDKESRAVRGIYSSDLFTATKNYLENSSKGRFAKLDGFEHIKALVKGKELDSNPKLPKNVRFYNEDKIKRLLKEVDSGELTLTN